MNSHGATLQMKATEQSFPFLLFITPVKKGSGSVNDNLS